MARLKGLDVSECQGLIRWDDVPAEYVFIVAKETEGAFYKDPAYARNLMGAHRTGRAFAPYAFLRPSQDALAQAILLWDNLGGTMPDFRPALDLENADPRMTPSEIADFFLRCADAVEERFGVPPTIYTFPWFETSRVGPALTSTIADRFARCPLWMADYSKGESPSETAHPVVPAPWATWTFWQTIGDKSSRVPGIAGAVDHDLFNGDAEAFRAFRGLANYTPEPDPIVHPPIDFQPRVYDSDPTLRVVTPHVEIVDDTPPDEVA